MKKDVEKRSHEKKTEFIQTAHLDKIDRKILNLLQKDNQITNLALAEKVEISAPPCFLRVKRLRDEGIIVNDVSLVDPFKAGR